MGKPIKGDIVVISFPFSDLSGTKRRPAFVLAALDGQDSILCQITSRAKTDNYAIPLGKDDYASGSLTVESVIRPNRIFTAGDSLILYTACKAKEEKVVEVVDGVVEIIKT
jgi:mRNA interferase MazF